MYPSTALPGYSGVLSWVPNMDLAGMPYKVLLDYSFSCGYTELKMVKIVISCTK